MFFLRIREVKDAVCIAIAASAAMDRVLVVSGSVEKFPARACFEESLAS
jgi:hypothetical protein